MWKWKFNLIFISTQLSEMHGTVRVDARTESIFSNIPSAEIFLVFTHFMPLVSFYTTMKILENQRFSDVFRGYRKRPLSWNRLMLSHVTVSESFFKIRFYFAGIGYINKCQELKYSDSHFMLFSKLLKITLMIQYIFFDIYFFL